jgi:hypothetical protein
MEEKVNIMTTNQRKVGSTANPPYRCIYVSNTDLGQTVDNIKKYSYK